MGPLTVPARIFDPHRLAAVRATGLLDTGAEEPFDRLATLAATLLDAPFAFITVVDESRSFWKACIGVDATDPADRQNLVEESFCQYVIGSNEALIIGDTANDPRTRENPSIHSMGVAAWAGFPLRAPTGDVLGTFCVVDTKTRDWTERDQQILRTLALAAAGEVALRAAIEDQRTALALADEAARQARGEAIRSAALAHTLQQTLLPPHLPDVSGLEIAAQLRPAGSGSALSGDFYDAFEAVGGGLDMVLGDVCGKGVEAAKLTAFARHTLRAAGMRTRRPSDALRLLNDTMLQHQEPGQPLTFLTALYVHLDRAGDRWHATVSCGGHPPPLLLRSDGGLSRVPARGALIGSIPDPPLTDTTLTLAPGDVLVLHTDGVTDARRGDERYGEERLTAALADGAGASAESLVRGLLESVAGFAAGPLTDDAAVLVIRVPAKA